MEKCRSCSNALPFSNVSNFVNRVSQLTVTQPQGPLKSGLFYNAFGSNSAVSNHNGLSYLCNNALFNSSQRSHVPLVHTAMAPYYYRRQPNCFATGVTHGVRGAVVGSVFGAAMGLSSAVQSGFRGSAVLTFAGQGALRNAVAFGSWTAVYGFSRCGCVRMRGRDDMLNAAAAGAFTGAILTLASVRGYWRYNQSAVMTNAAASAMIAVMFHALNQM